MDAALLSMLSETVTIASIATGSTAASLYGVPKYSTSATSYKAHYTRGPRDMRDAQGNSVAVSGSVWVGSTSVIKPTDKITLPDGTSPPIVSVSQWSDEKGIYGCRIDLGF